VTELEGALKKVPEVTDPTLEYVVVKPGADAAPLRLRVECERSGAEADDVRRRCAAAVRGQLDIRAEVELVARGTLPRSGYKAVRVVDA
jgi:phenylacetate-coenzyme A ligase PaaK-like adenylate-forming protein